MYIFQYNWIMVRNYRLEHSILKIRSTIDRYCLEDQVHFLQSYNLIEQKTHHYFISIILFSRNTYQKSPQTEATLLR